MALDLHVEITNADTTESEQQWRNRIWHEIQKLNSKWGIVDVKNQTETSTSVGFNTGVGFVETHAKDISVKSSLRGENMFETNSDRYKFCEQNSSGQRLRLPTFYGHEDWLPFIFVLDRLGQIGNWSDQERLDTLVQCLRGDALQYYRHLPDHVQNYYVFAKDRMSRGYGDRASHAMLRDQLLNFRQNAGECVQDFCKRVLDFVRDRFKNTNVDVMHLLSVYIFLNGCNKKSAAQSVINRNPETIHEAFRLVEETMSNIQVSMRDKAIYQQIQFKCFAVPNPSKQTMQYPTHTDLNLSKCVKARLPANLLPIRNPSSPHNIKRCCRCKSKKHEVSHCPLPPSPKPKVCFICNSHTHLARECSQQRVRRSLDRRHDNNRHNPKGSSNDFMSNSQNPQNDLPFCPASQIGGLPVPTHFTLPNSPKLQSTYPNCPKVQSTFPNSPKVHSTFPNSPKVPSIFPNAPHMQSILPNSPRLHHNLRSTSKTQHTSLNTENISTHFSFVKL